MLPQYVYVEPIIIIIIHSVGFMPSETPILNALFNVGIKINPLHSLQLHIPNSNHISK